MQGLAALTPRTKGKARRLAVRSALYASGEGEQNVYDSIDSEAGISG